MSSVRLRQVTSDDIDWIFVACQDSEIQRWTTVPRPYTRDHALEFVSGSMEFSRWVIETIDGGQPIGVISIHEVVNLQASVGYWIAPRYRGKGFATRALHLVCGEIERVNDIGDIVVDAAIATIARDNGASRRAVERAGFELAKVQDGPAVEELVPVPTCVYVKSLRGRDYGPPAMRTNR